MNNEIDTLATALYANTDDLVKAAPDMAPWRPAVGFAPRLTDAELPWPKQGRRGARCSALSDVPRGRQRPEIASGR
uniref:hypothetical protein n=1 Tax=Nocardia lijiangensis TaxID=299618 RepID=UPI0009FE43AD|nr:hypothetical protein [Nocardia lijiangensis]